MAIDTRDIVAGAVKEAESGMISDGPEQPETSPTGTTVVDFGGTTEQEEGETAAPTGEVSPSSAAAAGTTEPPKKDLAAAVDKTPPPPPDDELTKELMAFGIHPPKPGQREGVFKWSKVRKIVENTRTKTAARFEKDLTETKAQLKQSGDRLRNMDAVDHMILNDPDRYIRTLATIHPQLYGKYAGLGTEGKAPPQAGATPPAKDDPRPPPDAKFEDGSLGYSPEGLDKLLEWQARRVESSVTAKVDELYSKRFGPIEKDLKRRTLEQQEVEQYERARPMVQAQIRNAKQIWGPLFQSKILGDKEDDPEILKAMDDHPDWSFDACVAFVLTPKLQANRETMRKDLIAEIQKAPAAAARSTPGSGGGGGASGPRTTADIVAEAVAAAQRG